MNIFDASETIPLIKKPVLTIGTFDGVHIGHQKIISRINKSAKEIGGESVLFTFYPHPRTVIFPDDDNLRLLQTQEEKLAKLKRFGLDNIIIYPFTKEFSRTSATHFVRDCLVNQIGAVKIVIGYNHQFGKNREGSLEQLRELAPIYGFEVEEIPAQEIDEVNVSSTKIRNALLSGEIETANKFLQEPFQLNGVVEHGKALGRTIGFPTANISIENKLKIIPKTGVYFVRCSVDNIAYFGMMNIGFRPTIDDQNAEKPLIE
ncbi:MAG: riboflavin biosynthesis protein RibF, partial [Crocinitomicaceae bacterium]